MKLPLLDRIIAEGLTSATVTADAAEECWEASENTGDARYSSIARTLELIAEHWEQKRMLATEGLDRVLRNLVPTILNAKTAQEGASWARVMRGEIAEALN